VRDDNDDDDGDAASGTEMLVGDDLKSTVPVLQMGSTVATSLDEGESWPKHCYILEIRPDDAVTGAFQQRQLCHRLRCVRPFLFADVPLQHLTAVRALGAEPMDPRVQDAVRACLKQLVEDSIGAGSCLRL